MTTTNKKTSHIQVAPQNHSPKSTITINEQTNKTTAVIVDYIYSTPLLNTQNTQKKSTSLLNTQNSQRINTPLLNTQTHRK